MAASVVPTFENLHALWEACTELRLHSLAADFEATARKFYPHMFND